MFGYEVKLYYDEKTHTETVTGSTTTYCILHEWNSNFSFPNAISVAAINEVGVGDHSPPVKTNTSG